MKIIWTFIFILNNIIIYSQAPQYILGFLRNVNNPVDEISNIQIEVDVNLKYFTDIDTSNFSIKYQIVNDSNSLLGYNYYLNDSINHESQWYCDNFIYTPNYNDSSLIMLDARSFGIEEFTKQRKNRLIVEWLSPDFTNKITEDGKIYEYDLSFSKITNEYTLSLHYNIPDVEYLIKKYVFNATTYYLTGMTVISSWDNMIQYFNYKSKNVQKIEKLDTVCNKNTEYDKFKLINYVEKEDIDSLFESLDVLPNFELPELNDKLISSSDFEKTTLLYFWYSSCFPCRKSSIIIDSLYNSLDKKKVCIIGVNPYDSKEEIINYRNFKKLHFPTLYRAKEYSIQIGLRAYPTIVVVDKNMKILFKYNGYSPEMYNDITNYVNKLIN